MAKHEWDHWTAFCTRCGASKQAVVEGVRVDCSDGVIAVSHLIAERRFLPVVAAFERAIGRGDARLPPGWG